MPELKIPPGELTVVVVTYNSAHAIFSCLQSLPPAVPKIVVDNASTDDTRRLVETFPAVTVVANATNVGFGRANNQGFQAVTTPYALMLNPDTEVSGQAIERLLETARKYPDAAIAAPRLVRANGEVEMRVMGPHEHHHAEAPFAPAGPFCTWFVTGAAWLCRMDALNKVGGFDENIFLYNEDVDLCLRLARAGYSLVVDPDAVIGHKGGGSVAPSDETQLRKDWHQTWSHFYLASKYGDAAEARREAWRLWFQRGSKGLFYLLMLRFRRARGNFTKAQAAWWFLRGGPARPY
ncbi:MAG: glycosyltransferase family 2 protein [Rhodospirillaceae bacterium]